MDGWIEWTKFSWLYIKKTHRMFANETNQRNKKKLIRPKVYNKKTKTTNIYMCVSVKLIWHIRYIQQQQPIYRIKPFFAYSHYYFIYFYFFALETTIVAMCCFVFGRRGCRFIYIKCVKEERRRKKKKKIVLHKLQPAINYNNTLCVSFFVWNEMKIKWMTGFALAKRENNPEWIGFDWLDLTWLIDDYEIQRLFVCVWMYIVFQLEPLYQKAQKLLGWLMIFFFTWFYRL